MHEVVSMVVGVFSGISGMVLAVLAYPAYKNVVKKEREKAAPEILKLTEELMK